MAITAQSKSGLPMRSADVLEGELHVAAEPSGLEHDPAQLPPGRVVDLLGDGVDALQQRVAGPQRAGQQLRACRGAGTGTSCAGWPPAWLSSGERQHRERRCIGARPTSGPLSEQADDERRGRRPATLKSTASCGRQRRSAWSSLASRRLQQAPLPPASSAGAARRPLARSAVSASAPRPGRRLAGPVGARRSTACSASSSVGRSRRSRTQDRGAEQAGGERDEHGDDQRTRRARAEAGRGERRVDDDRLDAEPRLTLLTGAEHAWATVPPTLTAMATSGVLHRRRPRELVLVLEDALQLLVDAAELRRVAGLERTCRRSESASERRAAPSDSPLPVEARSRTRLACAARAAPKASAAAVDDDACRRRRTARPGTAAARGAR